VYLFRRQVEILLNSYEMGVTTLGGKANPVQIVERGMRWILNMGRWLRENSVSPFPLVPEFTSTDPRATTKRLPT
jgi:hypothetical protein